MRIALVQHDIVWEAPAENHARLTPLVAEAADAGSGLVLLSEMFATGFSMRTDVIAEDPHGPSVTFLHDRAQHHGVHVGGSIALRLDGPGTRPYNTFVVAHPDGSATHYSKLHPFSYGREHEHYAAGRTPVTVTIDGLRISLFVCYDLRFATAMWDLAPQTDCYAFVANWPQARRAHWRALLVARAIENQAWVVGVNRVGAAPRLQYAGDSLIVDPLGSIIRDAGDTEGVVSAPVDAESVARVRSEFPFLADRRERPSAQ